MLYNIHSADRTTGESTNFQVEIQSQKINKIKLKSIELPLTFYNIRENYNRLSFVIISSSNVEHNYTLNLDLGYYNITQLVSLLNTVMNNIISQSTTLTITNNQTTHTLSFTLTNSYRIKFNVNNLSKILGVSGKQSIISTPLIGDMYVLNYDKYLFLNISNLTTNNKSTNQVPFYFKIPITNNHLEIMYLTENLFYKQELINEYNNVISNLQIQLLDQNGEYINFNNVNFSFTLEIE